MADPQTTTMPTSAQLDRAARKWRDTKDRETDGFDLLYFLNNWAALPGLREFVDREMAA